jgi:hypothetical protein
MGINMGIGRLGEKATAIKRKYRFLATISPYCSKLAGKTIEGGFVKSAKRPGWEVEETQLDFLNARTWIAGKHSYTEIEIVYIDAGVTEIANLISWVGQLGNINNSVTFEMGTSFQDYAADLTISMLDGCGEFMEIWQIHNAWPKTADFGELAYGESEEAQITISLRYDSVDYFGFCPNVVIDPCCTPCS